MNDQDLKPRLNTVLETQRPRLHKVVLVNDDYTPRDFVVRILKTEFRMTESQAHKVMMTAHQRGRLRGGRVHQGDRREQGDQRDGCGPEEGLSAAADDRARGVGSSGQRQPPVRLMWRPTEGISHGGR